MEAKLQELEFENAILKQKIQELENRLLTYTNNQRHKKYYEENKDAIKQKANQYLKKLATDNPDKLKEYRHRAYLKQKEKKNSTNTQG